MIYLFLPYLITSLILSQFTFFFALNKTHLPISPTPSVSSSVYNTTVVALAMIGKVAITGGYQAIMLFSSELFPTEVRSRGVSSSYIFSRIGSILSPFITDLMVSVVN